VATQATKIPTYGQKDSAKLLRPDRKEVISLHTLLKNLGKHHGGRISTRTEKLFWRNHQPTFSITPASKSKIVKNIRIIADMTETDNKKRSAKAVLSFMELMKSIKDHEIRIRLIEDTGTLMGVLSKSPVSKKSSLQLLELITEVYRFYLLAEDPAKIGKVVVKPVAIPHVMDMASGLNSTAKILVNAAKLNIIRTLVRKGATKRRPVEKRPISETVFLIGLKRANDEDILTPLIGLLCGAKYLLGTKPIPLRKGVADFVAID
jgi:hypothetical protein